MPGFPSICPDFILFQALFETLQILYSKKKLLKTVKLNKIKYINENVKLIEMNKTK